MGAERWAALVLAGAALLARPALAAQPAGAQSPAPAAADVGARPAAARGPARIDVDLQGRVKDLEVIERDGRLLVRDEPEAEPVPAEAWLRALGAAQAEQRAQGFLYVLFNITKPWSFAWVAVGFAGQALFTLRMVLQWYASEKEKRSVIPVGFWWGSLFGGILLFVYFVWRKDIVGILGQSTGVFVYARNLILIHRRTAALARGTH